MARRHKKQRGPRTAFSLKQQMLQLTDDEAALQRFDELRAAVDKEPNCELRDDSRLAWLYITQTDDGGGMLLTDVVKEMRTVQFLYNATPYNDLCQSDMKRVAEHMKQRYPNVSWKAVWALVRETMVPFMKIEAVRRVGMGF